MPLHLSNLITHITTAAFSNPSDLLSNAKEFIKDKLYFACLPYHPAQQQDIHFFSIDHTLIYINFYSDFGPNNLAHVFRFCEIMRDKLKVTLSFSQFLFSRILH
jgi:cell division cycle 14